MVEVRSGLTTSFWYDKWYPIGRLYEVLGDRGFIDMGINSDATVAGAFLNHRRRCHRVEVLNQIKNEMESLRSRGQCLGEDVALWRRRDGHFRAAFSTSETWNQVRREGHVKDWHKGFRSLVPHLSIPFFYGSPHVIDSLLVTVCSNGTR